MNAVNAAPGHPPAPSAAVAEGLSAAARWRDVRRLLAVRLDNLGDVLMTTPALAAARARWPAAHVTLLASPSGAALAPYLPMVDETVAFEAPWVARPDRPADGRLGAAERALVEQLERGRYDAAIVFTVCTQSALPAALLCRLAGIPRRLAYSRENPYGLLSDWRPEADVPSRGMRHEVERQLDLVRSVGCDAAGDRLVLHYAPADAHAVAARLREAGVEAGVPYFVVHPGATAASRRYPPERYGTAADAVVAATGYRAVFAGGPAEREAIEAARGAMSSPSSRLDAGLGLGELAALIAGAQVTLCNNSAPAHVAAATGSPVVVLYALTNPQHTPWRTPARVLYRDVPCRDCLKSRCPEGHHQCLRGVPASAVADAALELAGLPRALRRSDLAGASA